MNEDEWKSLSNELSDYVRKQINQLQNPTDCKSSAKLFWDSGVLHKCGFGCQVHKLMYAFIEAYFQRRTFIVDPEYHLYDKETFNGLFEPLSGTCKYVDEGKTFYLIK